MMDFSGHAGAGSDFDLLPKGLLAWAYLSVRGLKTGGSGSQYLDVELTIAEGQPFAGRKLWDKIGHPFFQGNSEKYRQMGTIAITRICEAARNASPDNPAGYQLASFEQLNGLKVPIKVGIEGGEGGHDDKNRVAEWLTPNPASQSGHKGYAKLIGGDHGIAAPAGNAPSGAGAFGSQAGGSPAAGNGFGNSGFGNGGSASPSPQPANSGFGNTGSGFQAPPADSSGQSGASGAASATDQHNSTGFASTGDATGQSRSDPQQTPNWLAQAGGTQAQG